MCNQKQNLTACKAQCLPTLFFIYDAILPEKNIGVFKDGLGQFEPDTVLFDVDPLFNIIPLEMNHGY
jgi:hypothetical protein